MSDSPRYTYTYLNKRAHDAALYGYAFVALAASILALYRFFPAMLSEDAGAMTTAIFVVLVSLCTLLLVWPVLTLKKKRGWFIRKGSATLSADGVTFSPGATIAFADIFRVSCKTVADFGNRYEVLRIGYGTKSFSIFGCETPGSGEETDLTRLAHAIGRRCEQLESAGEDGEILYRRPAPPEDPNAIHFHNR